MSETFLKQINTRIAKGMETKDYYTVMLILDQLGKEYDGIPVNYQVTYCKCLIHTRQYLRCIELINRFRDSGNTSTDLIFAAGLCFYNLKRYSEAASFFSQKSHWAWWYKKSLIMERSRLITIQIGDFHNDKCFDIIRTIHTEEKVKMLLSVGNFMKKEIEVDFGYDWVDVTGYKHGKVEVTKNFELFAPILAQESFFHFSKEGLNLTLKKKTPGNWPEVLLMGEIDKNCVKEEAAAITKSLPEACDSEVDRQFRMAQLAMLGTIEQRIDRLCKKSATEV